LIRSSFNVPDHLAKRVLAIFALSLSLSPLAQAAAPEPSAQTVYAQALALSDRLLPLPTWSQSPAFAAFRQALLAAPEGLDAAGIALHFNRSQQAAKLGFSHFALLAPQPEAPAASAPAAPAALPKLSWPRPGVALLSIPSFALEAAQMLPAAQALAAARPEALIIDLRGNAGAPCRRPPACWACWPRFRWTLGSSSHAAGMARAGTNPMRLRWRRCPRSPRSISQP